MNSPESQVRRDKRAAQRMLEAGRKASEVPGRDPSSPAGRWAGRRAGLGAWLVAAEHYWIHPGTVTSVLMWLCLYGTWWHTQHQCLQQEISLSWCAGRWLEKHLRLRPQHRGALSTVSLMYCVSMHICVCTCAHTRAMGHMWRSEDSSSFIKWIWGLDSGHQAWQEALYSLGHPAGSETHPSQKSKRYYEFQIRHLHSWGPLICPVGKAPSRTLVKKKQ